MREDTLRSRRFAKILRAQMTDAETILWSRLRAWRGHGYAFRRQHPIGPYIADFACVRAKFVVELDGDQHGSDERHAYDLRRDAYMTSHGWRVLRHSNTRIYKELGTVLKMLTEMIPPPSPDGDTSPALLKPCGVEASFPRGRKD